MPYSLRVSSASVNVTDATAGGMTRVGFPHLQHTTLFRLSQEDLEPTLRMVAWGIPLSHHLQHSLPRLRVSLPCLQFGKLTMTLEAK